MWTMGLSFKYSWRKIKTELDGEEWSVAYVPLAVTRHKVSQVIHNVSTKQKKIKREHKLDGNMCTCCCSGTLTYETASVAEDDKLLWGFCCGATATTLFPCTNDDTTASVSNCMTTSCQQLHCDTYSTYSTTSNTVWQPFHSQRLPILVQLNINWKPRYLLNVQ